MICKCGGHLLGRFERIQTSQLKWKECGACGRCHGFTLRVSGTATEHGRTACAVFRELIREANFSIE